MTSLSEGLRSFCQKTFNLLLMFYQEETGAGNTNHDFCKSFTPERSDKYRFDGR